MARPERRKREFPINDILWARKYLEHEDLLRKEMSYNRFFREYLEQNIPEYKEDMGKFSYRIYKDKVVFEYFNQDENPAAAIESAFGAGDDAHFEMPELEEQE